MYFIFSACRNLLVMAIVVLMTESAYSQKILKKMNPIPQDQKDFVTKMQVAMINLKSAEFINNPVAKEEARTKATNELRTVKKAFPKQLDEMELPIGLHFVNFNLRSYELNCKFLPKPLMLIIQKVNQDHCLKNSYLIFR